MLLFFSFRWSSLRWILDNHSNFYLVPPCGLSDRGWNSWFSFTRKSIAQFLPRLSLASYLSWLSLHSFLTTKRHLFDVEPSYIPIFRLIITLRILNGFSPKLMLIIAFWRSTSVPNFSWIKVQVCELQRFFQVCEKTKKEKKNQEKNLKVCSLIPRKRLARFFSNLVCSLLW